MNRQERLTYFANAVRKLIGEQDYTKWISRLEFICDESTQDLVLIAPNTLIKRWVVHNYLSMFREIVKSTNFDPQGNDWNIRVTLKNTSEKANTTKTKQAKQTVKSATPQRRFSDNHNLSREWNFDSYIEGSSNKFALTTARDIANRGIIDANPVVFYSLSGMGKSHLVQSIVKHRLAQGVENIAYVRSERYFREMFGSVTNKDDQFSNFYRKLDLLIIDDIQFFAGKQRTQDEFFHTFNSLYERGKQMVFTCDTFPKGMKDIEVRITSRFGMGISISIDPPDLETRMAILQAKANANKLELNDDCALYMAEIVKSNVRELEGALGNVVARARFHNRSIDIAIIKEALSDLIAQVERSITLTQIQKEVSDYYHIKLADMLSPSKSRSFTRPRQMAMLLAKELTSKSLPEIGNDFGGRDHSTVIYAIQKVRELMRRDQTIYNDYRNLERLLLG